MNIEAENIAKDTLKLDYTEGGRECLEFWEYDGFTYCPACGHKGIWRELHAEDYYVGGRCMCANCGGVGHMWGAMIPEDPPASRSSKMELFTKAENIFKGKQ